MPLRKTSRHTSYAELAEENIKQRGRCAHLRAACTAQCARAGGQVPLQDAHAPGHHRHHKLGRAWWRPRAQSAVVKEDSGRLRAGRARAGQAGQALHTDIQRSKQ